MFQFWWFAGSIAPFLKNASFLSIWDIYCTSFGEVPPFPFKGGGGGGRGGGGGGGGGRHVDVNELPPPAGPVGGGLGILAKLEE